MTHRMMAWLGTALKSSQPRRNTSCRSDSAMVLMIGAAALPGAVDAIGVTSPWIGVAMVAISLAAAAGNSRRSMHASDRLSDSITIRPDAKTGNRLAMSRTEHSAYS